MGAIPEPAPNLPRVLKKNLIPVKNPFIKFQPRPIRGGAGRVPEKTRPVAIPICDSQNAICLTKNQGFYGRTKHIDVRLHFLRI